MVNSNQKGKRGERILAAELNALFGTACRRSQQFSGRGDGPADVVGIDGLHIESKFVEKLSLFPVMERAVEDCGDDVPVVAWKKKNKDWLLTVRLQDLKRLVNALKELSV